jgi:hypothetical protein
MSKYWKNSCYTHARARAYSCAFWKASKAMEVFNLIEKYEVQTS